MKLATLRTSPGTTRAARLERDQAVLLDAPDVGALLAMPGWREEAVATHGDVMTPEPEAYAPVVTAPGKVLCVGLNYRKHIVEMGRELPSQPTLFTKFAESLIGAHDDIVRPAETQQLDWEGELAVVIGAVVRRADEQTAVDAIAGFAPLNDVTCRDWQYRTTQWLQGKAWEGTTPIGPVLTTPDEVGGPNPALGIRTLLDGEVVQESNTGDLVFDPVSLVRYISTMTTLRPGDIIATGTPGGVGHARKPPRYLAPGQELVTEIDGLGRCKNLILDEAMHAERRS